MSVGWGMDKKAIQDEITELESMKTRSVQLERRLQFLREALKTCN